MLYKALTSRAKVVCVGVTARGGARALVHVPIVVRVACGLSRLRVIKDNKETTLPLRVRRDQSSEKYFKRPQFDKELEHAWPAHGSCCSKTSLTRGSARRPHKHSTVEGPPVVRLAIDREVWPHARSAAGRRWTFAAARMSVACARCYAERPRVRTPLVSATSGVSSPSKPRGIRMGRSAAELAAPR